jgi:hypothetical protein
MLIFQPPFSYLTTDVKDEKLIFPDVQILKNGHFRVSIFIFILFFRALADGRLTIQTLFNMFQKLPPKVASAP